MAEAVVAAMDTREVTKRLSRQEDADGFQAGQQ